MKIHLFTRQLDHIVSYDSDYVPREGDHITRGDAHYRVKTVTWEEPDSDEPSVQIRVEVIDDG